MLPLALLACHGMAFGSIYRFGRSDKNAVTGPLVLCLVPIVVMASWWALLLSVGELGWTEYPAYWFFIKRGKLPPQEIFGPEFALYLALAWFSLAATLGCIPAVMAWLVWRRTRGIERPPNMAVKLPVHVVTGRACARPAPTSPAAYGRR